MREDIRQMLIESARDGKVIHYMELDVGRGKTLGKVLEDISVYEANQGRPLLSAIAVSKVKGMPNEGFWKIPGIRSGLTEKEQPIFWAREVIRVIDYWQSH